MNKTVKRLALAAITAATVLGTPAVMAVSAVPAASAASWPAGWVLPNHHLTPGAWGHDIAQVCPHVDPALEAGRPSTAVKNQVYAEYGITHHVYGQYEIDHLVPLELDGSNSKANLWPEPGLHNPKDVLENRLHYLVCGHKVSLATAQHAIDTDWRVAYVKYVGKP
jgi:hypothetical protein